MHVSKHVPKSKYFEIFRNYGILDPWRYILNDPEMEKKLDMNLKQSLKRSCEKKLLAGETVLLAVNKNFDVLKGIYLTVYVI